MAAGFQRRGRSTDSLVWSRCGLRITVLDG
jgi:hypothetical protein